jgi:plasmid stabilization system protein ParE
MEEAYRWYEHERAGLGEEFLEAVRSLVAAIAEHPERFPVIHRQSRRALMRRFPYGIFYRVESSMIVLVACFHSRRNPRIWQSRH